MRKWVCMAVTVAMVLAAFSAFADTTAENGPFTPFENEYVVKAVYGYGGYDNAYITPGTTPENTLSNYFLQKFLNVKVEWLWTVPSEQYNQKLQLSLTSGEYPDVLNVDAVMYRNLLESGMLLDIASAFDTFISPDIRAQYELTDFKMAKEVTDADGHMYAFPVGEDVLMQSIACYYRKDWADKLGLAEPKSMQDIAAMAEAFATQDPDGNGVADTYGIAAFSSPINSQSLNGVFWSFGSYPSHWIKDESGKIVSGTTLPQTYEALKLLRGLYTKGGLSKEYATLSAELMYEDLIASKCGIYYALWWSPNYPLNINYQKDYSAEWAGVPLLAMDGEMANNLNTERMSSGYRVAFNNGKERLDEALVKIINLGYDINFVSNKERTKEVYPEKYLPTEGEEGFDPAKTVAYEWYWWPVHIVPPSQYVNMYFELNEAFKTGDTSLLRNSEYEAIYKQWQYLNSPNAVRESDEYGTAWGGWFSRAYENGGMGTMLKHREAGKIVDDVYYGDPTPTMVERQSDIDSMVSEYFNRFIMGDVAEDSWDGFVAEWNSMGGEQITAEVNEQYAALH